MKTIEQHIDVDVPPATAYAGWKRFDAVPQYMKGVESIHPRGTNRQHWTVEIGGVRREWDAEICEEIPGKRIAWNSVRGVKNSGCVSFHRITDDRTRVMLQIGYEPKGIVETAGDLLGIVQRRVAGDLALFKERVEDGLTPIGDPRVTH